jgi:hypothetical protein
VNEFCGIRACLSEVGLASPREIRSHSRESNVRRPRGDPVERTGTRLKSDLTFRSHAGVVEAIACASTVSFQRHAAKVLLISYAGLFSFTRYCNKSAPNGVIRLSPSAMRRWLRQQTDADADL